MDYEIRKIKFEDYDEVSKIYFAGEIPENIDPEAFEMPWDVWIRERVPGCTIVAVKDNFIRGWAALTPLWDEKAYSEAREKQTVRVAEESVYVAERYREQGLGQALLKKIIELSEKSGIHTLEARILPTNTTSIALHKKFGFKEVDSDERRDKFMKKGEGVTLMERKTILMERNTKKKGFHYQE